MKFVKLLTGAVLAGVVALTLSACAPTATKREPVAILMTPW